MAAQDPVPFVSDPSPPAPEPSGFISRHFPPATWVELLAGLMFLALSLLAAYWVAKSRYDVLALDRNSALVEGKVLRLWKTATKGGWQHRVEYEFTVPWGDELRTIRDQTIVPEENFNGLQEDGPIAVVVCRTDAANHQVIGEHARLFATDTAMVFSLAIVTLFATAGGINLWWWWVSRRMPRQAQFVILGVRVVESRASP
jgi:hypothetical protein